MSDGKVSLTVAGALSDVEIVPSFCLRQGHGGVVEDFIAVVFGIVLGVVRWLVVCYCCVVCV
jgi:hypothetical protein